MPDGLTGRLRMPSLGGATGWLNSQPLGRADLHGSSTVHPRASRTTSTSTRTATGCSSGRLYKLVRERDAVRERTLEIAFLDAGAEASAFTFG